MSNKGLKAFEAALKADEGLRRKYEEALSGITEAACDGEAMQKAAAQLGFEVTLEELERAWASSQELDVSELSTVAGGQSYYQNRCLVGWCCYTVVKHPDDIPDVDQYGSKVGSYECSKALLETFHTEACWSDYNCVWFNKEDDPGRD